MLDALTGRSVLLLQGPAGPFFRRLACELEERGAQTLRVTFNAGDGMCHFGMPAVAFREPMEHWPAFLERLLDARAMDAIVLYGDMRPIHVAARQIAKARGIPVYVFEEGYLRPDYITMEREGVNGNSDMSKDPQFYLEYWESHGKPELDPPIPVGHTFTQAAVWSTVHAMAATIFFFLYPHYQHHRELNCWLHTYWWVRGAFRKYLYRFKERGILERLEGEHRDRFFLVPLQVYCDAQLEHSDFDSVEEFATQVARSFAADAPADHVLVFKHHPVDRAYVDYTQFMRALAADTGLGDRIIYIHDLHLPSMLKAARGTVVINSTVGLSSIHHGTPVAVLGEAVYKLPGLVFEGSLEAFWRVDERPDQDLYDAFSTWLRVHNQSNGNVWRRVVPGTGPTGVRWCRGVLESLRPQGASPRSVAGASMMSLDPYESGLAEGSGARKLTTT